MAIPNGTKLEIPNRKGELPSQVTVLDFDGENYAVEFDSITTKYQVDANGENIRDEKGNILVEMTISGKGKTTMPVKDAETFMKPL